ncbi:YggT family protein [Oleiagrimonas soli]|uniref:YggT family protein n=1 Tax=Oleiagrimonas soli TaxID=1543381 RepID=A0A099CY78_9GAMM|nr:YggT family protein [Oleiagrimonas soli]KGI78616.1 hypothetical protein LF63_0103995 [Oleiagrimonas soli]MBB6184087.1 YggT family protein [Oleiagrimonas soli]
MSYFLQAAQLILEFVFGAVATLFLLRMIAEAARVQFHNPISQFVYRSTNPVLAPLRRVLRNWRNINLAAIAVAWLAELVKLGLEFLLAGGLPNPAGWLLLGFGQLLDLFLLVYIVLIFVWSLGSLLGGDPGHPLLRFVAQLVEPPMRPLRRRMPTLGGLDFSPAVAILVLMLLRILVAGPLIGYASSLIVGA